MKIAFRGFRGFAHDTKPIDLRDITLFTGKNGSGKSTFIKLLRLMSDSLKSVHTMEDMMKLKINIGTELLGGLDHLLFDKEIEPQWVFEVDLDFYRGIYLVIVSFNIDKKTLLSVQSIELVLTKDDQGYDPIAVWKDNDIFFHWKNLNSEYLDGAIIYNVLEACRYYIAESEKEKNHHQINRVIRLTPKERKIFEEFLEVIEYPELRSILRSNSNDVLLKHVNGKKNPGKNMPFHIREHLSHKNEYGMDEDYHYLFSSEINLKPSVSEVNKLVDHANIPEKSILDYFIEIQREIDSNYDFSKMVLEKAQWPFELNFIPFSIFTDKSKLELPGYKFYLQWEDICKKVREEFSFDRFKSDRSLQEQYGDYYEEFLEDEFDGQMTDFYDNIGGDGGYYPATLHNLSRIANEFIKKTISLKYDYYTVLFNKSKEIFESGILRELKKISQIAFQSNVSYQVERTYNIYKEQNHYSRFLNLLDNKNPEVQNKILDTLNHLINLLGLERSFLYEIKENAGFIYLKNEEESFNLIDEGSGTSKVIGILFFLLSNIYDFKDEDHTSKMILVIEEPESNLHPSLQSKLANLFIEIIKNQNVKLLIETHSEYMIRKLQYLVATEEIDKEKIGIHYFSMNRNEEGKRQIEFYEIPIEKDGRLSRGFGPGFFDEADNLAIELFLLNKNKEN